MRDRVQQNDLKGDERWELVERIAATRAFQRSSRLRTLLLHITERTLHGYSDQLTEQQIGHAVFGKHADYSPLEDSSVRVHMRLLRLRLHEYFDESGRSEHLTLGIPKGSYVPVFRKDREANQELERQSQSAGHRFPRFWAVLPWALSGMLAIACLAIWRHFHESEPSPVLTVQQTVPWPLSQIFDSLHTTQIVVADANYGMLRIIAQKPGSLDDYLRPDYPKSFLLPPMAHEPIANYISDSLLTSYADVAVTSTLLRLAGAVQEHVMIRYARDMRLRDFDRGYFVLIGSPSSNPWVSIFENRLNFIETEGVVGSSRKWFLNRRPLLGEQATYEGLPWTGQSGKDYASIAMVPNRDDNGRILMLQGLQQEGTEAAGLFLADPAARLRLQRSLGVQGQPRKPVWFEALIRTDAMAGAPESASIVAVRRIH
ncbi:MAG: hypothetical protein EPN47_16075 [Acidobacteria bacterium]|nr:MAG: hypothetical protein EPN47_16075 [Acidobacteriota bacterium]